MPIIDPTTNLGKIRLRIGDWNDIPILPDVVIDAALLETEGNLQRASVLCSQYILATLTSKSHEKLGQIEVWGSEVFNNYVKFLKMTILNPSFSGLAPVPYVGTAFSEHPLQVFAREWREGYTPGSVVIPSQEQPTIIEHKPS